MVCKILRIHQWNHSKWKGKKCYFCFLVFSTQSCQNKLLIPVVSSTSPATAGTNFLKGFLFTFQAISLGTFILQQISILQQRLYFCQDSSVLVQSKFDSLGQFSKYSARLVGKQHLHLRHFFLITSTSSGRIFLIFFSIKYLKITWTEWALKAIYRIERINLLAYFDLFFNSSDAAVDRRAMKRSKNEIWNEVGNTCAIRITYWMV